MLELLDPPPGLLERVRLLADQLVAERNLVGERQLGIIYANIVCTRTTSERVSTAKITRIRGRIVVVA
jgi:hypothetical protein